MSRANVDDPCEPTMEGRHACSADEKGRLVCRGSEFVIDEPCGPGKLCNPETLRCERR
jgi:hypothetical protein